MKSSASYLIVSCFALGLAAIAGATATESRDSACAGCHLPPETRFVARSMAAQPADLASAHAQVDAGASAGSGVGAGLRCIDCHAGEGATGHLRALWLGAKDFSSHVRGDYIVVDQEYLPYGEAAHPDALRACTSCHADDVAVPGHEKHFHNLLDDSDAPFIPCASCHRAHALGLPAPDFVDEVSISGACVDCHSVMGGPSAPLGWLPQGSESPALALLKAPRR